VLNVVDDYTRESVLQVADCSISGARAARELDRLAKVIFGPGWARRRIGRESVGYASP